MVSRVFTERLLDVNVLIGAVGLDSCGVWMKAVDGAYGMSKLEKGKKFVAQRRLFSGLKEVKRELERKNWKLFWY